MEYSEIALQKVREDRLLINEVDQWLYEEISPYMGQRVLEIGCGLGNFARHLSNRQLYIGTETSRESIEHMQQLFGSHSNMKFSVADATALSFLDFSREKIDTVFSLNVFEHIEDHEAALKNAREILQPGGNLILVVPAHMALYGTMDLAIGHYRRYNKAMMADLMRQVGLQLTTQKYINAVGAFGWWLNARVLHAETPPSNQLGLFNHIVPALKQIEKRVTIPFGISLLAVARRNN
ncbi:MAG: class I SAM-dependent methyltransferase [Anaerolineae bacterium]